MGSPTPRRAPAAPVPAPARDAAAPSALGDAELVLLGLVAEEPTHAYRVAEQIRSRRMADWSDIGFSSIYRLLASLERRGLVRARLEHGGQGATRKIHDATPRGRAALAEAVLARLGRVERSGTAFQVALAFVTHAPRAEVLARLAERAERVGAALSEVRRLRKELPGVPPAGGPGVGALLERRRWTTARLLLDDLDRRLAAERGCVRGALRRVGATPERVFAGAGAP